MNEMNKVRSYLNEANSELNEFLSMLSDCIEIDNEAFLKDDVKKINREISNQSNIIRNSIIPAIKRAKRKL